MVSRECSTSYWAWLCFKMGLEDSTVQQDGDVEVHGTEWFDLPGHTPGGFPRFNGSFNMHVCQHSYTPTYCFISILLESINENSPLDCVSFKIEKPTVFESVHQHCC